IGDLDGFGKVFPELPDAGADGCVACMRVDDGRRSQAPGFAFSAANPVAAKGALNGSVPGDVYGRIPRSAARRGLVDFERLCASGDRIAGISRAVDGDGLVTRHPDRKRQISKIDGSAVTELPDAIAMPCAPRVSCGDHATDQR